MVDTWLETGVGVEEREVRDDVGASSAAFSRSRKDASLSDVLSLLFAILSVFKAEVLRVLPFNFRSLPDRWRVGFEI